MLLQELRARSVSPRRRAAVQGQCGKPAGVPVLHAFCSLAWKLVEAAHPDLDRDEPSHLVRQHSIIRHLQNAWQAGAPVREAFASWL